MYYDPEKKKIVLSFADIIKGRSWARFQDETAGIEARFIFFFNKRPGF